MSYREIVPHPALREHVDRFWVELPAAGSAAPSSAAAALRHILPDGCIDVLLVLPRRSIEVVGTMTRALHIHALPLATAAVRFRPGAAMAFLGVAAQELTDRQLAASELSLHWLEPRLLDAPDPLAAVAQLEQALLRRQAQQRAAAGRSASGRLVAHVVRACFGSLPTTVHALAQECGYSRQRLSRVVLEEVGLGTKELLRVGRLQRTVAELQSRPSLSLAHAALDLGYSDQAHLCRDFRELVGLSPGAVRGAADSIFPIHSLLAGA